MVLILDLHMLSYIILSYYKDEIMVGLCEANRKTRLRNRWPSNYNSFFHSRFTNGQPWVIATALQYYRVRNDLPSRYGRPVKVRLVTRLTSYHGRVTPGLL